MHGASRTSWPVIAAAVGGVAVVLLVRVLPSTDGVLPLVGRIAELALAGSAAYAVDDAAAALTTVAPRGVWRRRAPALALAGVLLGGAWAVVLVVLRSQGSSPAPAVSGELLVLGLVAVAAAGGLARRGDPEPGARVAPALVLLGVSLVILESVLRRPLLLPWDRPAGTGLLLTWVAAGAAALVVAWWTSRDPASPRAAGHLTF